MKMKKALTPSFGLGVNLLVLAPLHRTLPAGRQGWRGGRVARWQVRWILFAFCILSFSFSAARAQTAEVNVASVITALEIKGHQLVPEREIMAVVFTRVGDTLIEEKIKSDLKAVYALGYFADVRPVFEPLAGGTKVIIEVTENPKLEDIAIDGNTVYATAEILASLETKRGEILNFKKIQDDIEKINARYKKDGYILARVVDVETDKKTKVLNF